MVREVVNDNDIKQIDLIIKADILQNPYLYIDLQVYGYCYKDYITTWIVEESNEIHAILYQYYNTLQVFCLNRLKPEESKEICAYILKNKFVMISGSAEAMEEVFCHAAPYYRKSHGYILAKEDCGLQKNMKNKAYIATEADCHEIAELICSQENIGAHYTIDVLEEQLVDRMKNRGCKNVIIRKDNRIVSHMGVYADGRKIAVLGGLVTHPDYRGAGYGPIVLDNLAGLVISEGKKPILFCYEDKLIKWYRRQGWKIKTECAKLVRVHDSEQ